MLKNKLKIFFIVGILFAFLPHKSSADYSFDVEDIPDSFPSSNSSTFSLTKDSATCSSGGGSIPSLWIGAQQGNGDINGTTDNTLDETNEYISGGVAFVIPLGRKNSSNCKNILTMLELQEFLSTIDSLNDMGVIDKTKIANVIQNYMKKVSKDLGVDLYSAIKPNAKLLTTSELSDDGSSSNVSTSSDN